MEDEQDGLDHTSAIALAVESEDLENVRMILGDRENIRPKGLIRAGVKVPKKACSETEIKLFKELEAKGLDYNEIDRKMGGEPKTARSKLTPRNVDHFIIRDNDFNNPADAQMVRSKYADPDGQVRRVPIWFKTSDISRVMPHSFKAYDAAENVRAYSSYDEEGNLVCQYVPKEIVNPKKEDWQKRPCDPDVCSQVSAKKCCFGGWFRFSIPGLKGIGDIIAPTKSWYGLGNAMAVLKEVRKIQGRFDGLFQGETFMELVKVQELVKLPDGSKKNQWIITLDISIDPMEMVKQNDPKSTALRASAALRALVGDSPVAESVSLPVMTSTPSVTLPLEEEDLGSEETGGEPPLPDDMGTTAASQPAAEENQQEEDKAASVPPMKYQKTQTPISDFQRKHIIKELGKKGIIEETFNKYFIIADVADLDTKLFNEAVEAIKKGTFPA